MSQGEFNELVREMVDDGRPNSGTLQAWSAGEPVTALELWAALKVDAGLAVVSDRGHELVDLVLTRLDAEFPGLAHGEST